MVLLRVIAGDFKTLPPVRLQHFVSLIHFNGKKLKDPVNKGTTEWPVLNKPHFVPGQAQYPSRLKALLQTTHIMVKIEQKFRAAVYKPSRVVGRFPWCPWCVAIQET